MLLDIKKPIFINGLGRSGSSIFHQIFSKHPQVAWLSPLCDRYPKRPELNRMLMKSIDLPVAGKYLARYFGPEECYGFWETYCRGFRTPCRDLVKDDVTEKSKHQIRNALSKTYSKNRERLLLKITGWPRIGYLKEIFNDAIFVHVKREPRAVANSFLDVSWWWGWRGPQNWRWGELTEEYKQLWEAHDKSFIALAGIAYRTYQDALDSAIQHIDNSSYIEVSYEEMCSNPILTFKNVVEICELNWTEEFERTVKLTKLKNSNYKWENDLTKKQKEILENVLNYKADTI
jgi:omega-hydroxy-beta-dihydromenaquinone-9 sulfotransferase